LSISEVMTIVIAFHGSGYRTFKDFYKQKALPDWRNAFHNLVSYRRFVELMPWNFMALVNFLTTYYLGEVTGISFIDSTSVAVCHVNRAKAHQTFKGLAGWGKSSVGWYFGFKLHLIINNYLVSGLIAYTYHPDKPSLGIPNDELKALPQAAF
jgi:hypothetical protein